jgi:hypothetical protein
LRCDKTYYYQENFDDNFTIAGIFGDKFEYNVVDFSTGAILKCVSEDAEQFSIYDNDEMAYIYDAEN